MAGHVYPVKSDGSVNVEAVVIATGQHIKVALPGHSKVKVERR